MELLNKIQKELNVGKSLVNKFGGYKYRSAEQILEAVKPLLGKGILTLSDEVVMFQCDGQVTHDFLDRDGSIKAKEILPATRFYVKATATLKDCRKSVSVSAYARETEARKGMDDAQVTGSASSYARKYALNGLFCLNDTQDADDMDNREPQAKTRTTTPPQSNYVAPTPAPQNEAKQEAQQAQEKLGNMFDQSAQNATPPSKRPAPSAAERNVLNVLREYWITQIKSPNVKVDNEKILDVTYSLLGRFATLDDCIKIKDETSPFYIALDKITKVVA
jgi:hypothetical protein